MTPSSSSSSSDFISQFSISKPIHQIKFNPQEKNHTFLFLYPSSPWHLHYRSFQGTTATTTWFTQFQYQFKTNTTMVLGRLSIIRNGFLGWYRSLWLLTSLFLLSLCMLIIVLVIRFLVLLGSSVGSRFSLLKKIPYLVLLHWR